MNRKARNLISGLFFISCTYQVYAQTSECDLALSHAESEFNAGHFYSIPSILNTCLTEAKFTQEAKVRAYLLLCQVYLVIDDPIAADDSYLKLLRADPEFVANEKDHPIDVVFLSKKFTATPIFTPHARIGFSTSFVRSIYSTSTEPYAVPTTHFPRFNVQIGGGIDWNINDNFSLCGELDFASRAYKTDRKPIAGGDDQTVVGTQFWLDLPIYLKYSYHTGNIRPFGYAGLAMNYLISAKNVFTYVDSKPDGSSISPVGPSEDVTYQRNRLNRSWVIGGGAKFKRGKDFFYIDLRYMGGLTNLANNKTYYLNPADNADKTPIANPNNYLDPDVTKYRYVSDLFRLDNVSISFGYIHPIYDPRKIKKAKTRSVSRKIKKEDKGRVK